MRDKNKLRKRLGLGLKLKPVKYKTELSLLSLLSINNNNNNNKNKCLSCYSTSWAQIQVNLRSMNERGKCFSLVHSLTGQLPSKIKTKSQVPIDIRTKNISFKNVHTKSKSSNSHKKKSAIKSVEVERTEYKSNEEKEEEEKIKETTTTSGIEKSHKISCLLQFEVAKFEEAMRRVYIEEWSKGEEEEEEKKKKNKSKEKEIQQQQHYQQVNIDTKYKVSTINENTLNWPFKLSFKMIDNSRSFILILKLSMFLMFFLTLFSCDSKIVGQVEGQMSQRSDPRPTIYSGQISFGLLISAHSSTNSELTTSASQLFLNVTPKGSNNNMNVTSDTVQNNTTKSIELTSEMSALKETQTDLDESDAAEESRKVNRRQIFERRQPIGGATTASMRGNDNAMGSMKQFQNNNGMCSQVNPNALFAGMGAIWASHQANLIGDSQFNIGAYVYDSCNDLDVGQRQSVRIVSNLNAFQQTTCESPRGSPISLTIAHGENQLRAIQLLTSFRVPVISTKEHFALEEYNQLTRDQRRFLFSTAPSSRHLALGALKFSRRIVAKSGSSAKLLNQFYKMSPRNGLIVISRNLPTRFTSYLGDTVPNEVNYELMQSSQPIDQIRSIESLENIFMKHKSSTLSSSSSLSNTVSESRLIEIFKSSEKADPSETLGSSSNQRRSDDSGSDGIEFDSAGDSDNFKMLSPTIVMFITPAEAIDLITRLRNDLAEVSRYYSLIVVTREDITSALKTIFHRGGSRLCSGKAFYTISPKSDDMSEFSRYFRDTVQVEGENSDHPLICEYARHQSTSRLNSDVDESSAEPVIKAVWTAASAFKLIHRRECGAHLTSDDVSSSQKSDHQTIANALNGAKDDSEHQRASRSRKAANGQKSAHSDCMIRISKNMSHLVQRALKRLDVTINSTGLHSLDGFKLKFDELNELISNRFSIRHINKECEIEEIGEFSGLKDSALRLDESTLAKSLESTLPDPWPVSSSRTNQASSTSGSNSIQSTSSTTDSSNNGRGSNSSPSSDSSSGSSVGDNGDAIPGITDAGTTSNEISSSSQKPKGSSSDDSSSLASNGDDENGTDNPASELNQGNAQEDQRMSARHQRASKQHRARKRDEQQTRSPQVTTTLVPLTTSLGGRRMVPGVTDTLGLLTTTQASVNGRTTTPIYSHAYDVETSTGSIGSMRKLKPFPNLIGTQVKDWLPITATDSTTTISPIQLDETTRGLPVSRSNNRDKTTSHPNSQSTLPESGGNTDLEIPAKSTVRSGKSSLKILDFAASTDSSDFVTASSTSKDLFESQYSHSTLPTLDGSSLDQMTLSPGAINQSQPYGRITSSQSSDLSFLNKLNFTPVVVEPSHLNGISSSRSNFVNGSSHQSIRHHLRWIYNSWFALVILIANICGAVLTLYVLTFLLMKNCDGSLDRNNQGSRSMHLLAIIVLFFGSTLFIVAPTPGLCLLRTSWHNFALVLLFGSLLSQTMQMRALDSLGLGGRPNRLNHLLTLLFLVGVQVSFELQRWR